jgi:hypothetical protein
MCVSPFRQYTLIDTVLSKGNTSCGVWKKLGFTESMWVNPLFLFAHLGKIMVNMTSVVLIRSRGMSLGVVSRWIQFDESSRGWSKSGVSPRRIRQNAQKKCPKVLQ